MRVFSLGLLLLKQGLRHFQFGKQAKCRALLHACICGDDRMLVSQVASSSASTLQHLPTNLALCDPPDATIGYEAVLQGAQVCYTVTSSHVHLIISKTARMPGY